MEVSTTTPTTEGPISTTKDMGPLPMSFPAILRTSGINDRFAHLRVGLDRSSSAPAPGTPKKNKRDDKEGKRWVRRMENGSYSYTLQFWVL